MDHSPGMSFNGSPAMGQPQYHEMQPVHYQHNGHQRHPPMPMATEAHFRVSEWQQPYDSGVHSLQHSQNPSVMSMPGSSRMSVVSVANTADLTDLQRQKFENIPLSFDAAQPEAASAAIPDLINLINDEDVTVAARALGFIQLTAKRDSETKFQKPIIHQLEAVKAIVELLEARQDLIPLIRHALGSLFYISNRPEGTQLVLIANHQLNGLMVRKLIDFIRNPETPYQKWAIPLLHTLIVDTKNSQVNIRQACDCGGVEALTHRLYYEANQKLLSIIVQSINILTVKNPAQTKLFFDQKGPDRLVQILGEFQYEGLLIGTVRFIGKLGAHADKLGALNAPLAVARCLHHGSHRLVDLSLDCLRNLSHSKTMQKQTEIVDFVIQVLGSSNLKHIQYCLDILTNMCTESKPNKERLCGNGRTVEYLISLLTLPYDLGSEKDNAGKDELQETVLLLLRILCHDHDYTRDVQHQLIQQGGCMWNMLQTMKPKLLWRTLQLIRRLENHLGMFAEARFGTETFAKTVVRILNIALSKLDMGSVDNVKVVDILQAALTVLSLFCHNGSLRDQIAADLLLPQNMTIQGGENVYLPVLVLQKNYPGKDEKTMKQPAMGIIAATVAYPQVAMRFKNDPIYMNGLHAMCRLPDYAPLAEIALKTLQEGVQPVYPPLRCAPPTTAGGPDRRFPPQRPSSPVQPEGPLPDDLAAIDDPFVNVFCPNQSHNSPPFSSPTDYQSPPSNSNPPSCRPPYDQMHPMNYQPDPYGSAHYGHHPPHQQYPPQQYYPAQQPYPQYYEQYPGGDYRYPPP